jgi:phosphopantothenoylcysteine synthetase/decarboxylase
VAQSDLLSLAVAATAAPVVMVPAMNAAMWSNAAVRRNVERLRNDGVYVVEPSVIFKATSVLEGDVMYGGPGTLWRGALGVSQTLSAAMAHKRNSSLVQGRPLATNGHRARHPSPHPKGHRFGPVPV